MYEGPLGLSSLSPLPQTLLGVRGEVGGRGGGEYGDVMSRKEVREDRGFLDRRQLCDPPGTWGRHGSPRVDHRPVRERVTSLLLPWRPLKIPSGVQVHLVP